MLLYQNGYFMQVLEGEEADVDTLYAKISQDPRHHHVLLVTKEPITERSFGEWSMGFKNLDTINKDSHPAFADFFNQSFSSSFYTESPSRTRELLLLFRDRYNW
ncbi:MAG: BLUF domain-containing protein [Anaerolineae bacterium]|nr:BLUF domain-containing protein [Anaerolineae bacterium]